MAAAYSHLDMWAEAAGVLETAVTLDETAVQTHYNLALIYLQLNQAAAARQQFQQVISLDAESLLGQQAKRQLAQLEP